MAVRCMVVDDNDCFLTAVRHMLERDGIAVVAVATDGAEALERVGETRPDVVLLDVCLGSESGFDIAERIEDTARAGGWAGRRPAVILISTHAEADVAERVAASPAVAFLDKTTLTGKRILEVLSTLPGEPPDAR